CRYPRRQQASVTEYQGERAGDQHRLTQAIKMSRTSACDLLGRCAAKFSGDQVQMTSQWRDRGDYPERHVADDVERRSAHHRGDRHQREIAASRRDDKCNRQHRYDSCYQEKENKTGMWSM